jgi:thiopurine S-methyltransferase
MCEHVDTSYDFKMTPDDWIKFWKDGHHTYFHSHNMTPIFLKSKEGIINGKHHSKVFVPLCGKAVEMKWLAENGHVVVGVDVSDDGIMQFFKENNLPYITKEMPAVNGTLYECSDRKMWLKLYCCSIYDFKPEVESRFDAVWDSGAFQASNKTDRKMYADIIHSVLKKDGKVFMAIEEFIQKDCGTLDTEVIRNNFGEMFTMKTTEFVEANEEYRKKFKINGSHVYVMSKN